MGKLADDTLSPIKINDRNLVIQQKAIGYWANVISCQDSARYVLSNFPANHRVFREIHENLDYALDEYIGGRILEFGVASGTSINYIAERTNELIDGFDSFKGLPEDWNSDFKKGAFAQDIPKVRNNIRLHVGLFEESIDTYLNDHPFEESEVVGFIHIDCDLYSSTRTVFEKIGEKISTGTVIVFDEYFNHPYWQQNEHKAFMEFIEKRGLNFQYESYVEENQQVTVRIT